MSLSRSVVLAVIAIAAVAVTMLLLRGADNLPAETPTHGPSKADAGPAPKSYAGSAACRPCHVVEFERWSSSHHALAEREVRPGVDTEAFAPAQSFRHGGQTSTAETDGDRLTIKTVGWSGTVAAYVPKRVIGTDPIRQYVVAAPNGSLHVLQATYEPASKSWFSVYGDEDRKPGEWGHWTGRGMSWNSMCAYCHNTALSKNYDVSSDVYRTTMAEMGVGCESCHGPLGAHVAWRSHPPAGHGADPTITERTREQQLATCGSCHARRAELTGQFVPGEPFDDHFALEIPDLGDVFYSDGQVRDEDYELTSFLSSRMHRAGVACQDCHDSHSGKTVLSGNALCLRCHDGGKANVPKIDPARHTFHKADSPGSTCVGCHMPLTTYMQRHSRRDHGFTIPDPQLTVDHAIPNACTRCHGDHPAAWAGKWVDLWFGAQMNRHTRARARVVARARAGDRSVAPDVLAMLEKEDVPLWRAVGARLAESFLADPGVTQALVRAAADSDPLVRAAAVRALDPVHESASGSILPAVTKALDDPVRGVRVAAAWAQRARLDDASRAARDLARHLEIISDQPTGQLQNGAFELARGHVDAALVHYKKAVAWDPYSAPLRHELAIAYSMTGRPKDAVAELEAACKLSPADADYRFRLGLAWSEAGSLPSAVAAFAKAVELQPRHARAWYNLGLARDQLGDPTALDALERAEHADPNDAAIPYARAIVLLKLGRKADAKHAAERAVFLRPGFTEAEGLLRAP